MCQRSFSQISHETYFPFPNISFTEGSGEMLVAFPRASHFCSYLIFFSLAFVLPTFSPSCQYQLWPHSRFNGLHIYFGVGIGYGTNFSSLWSFQKLCLYWTLDRFHSLSLRRPVESSVSVRSSNRGTDCRSWQISVPRKSGPRGSHLSRYYSRSLTKYTSGLSFKYSLTHPFIVRFYDF